MFLSEATQATKRQDEEMLTTTLEPKFSENPAIAAPSIKSVRCLFSISPCSTDSLSVKAEPIPKRHGWLFDALGNVALHNKDVCGHCSMRTRGYWEMEKAVRWNG